MGKSNPKDSTSDPRPDHSTEGEIDPIVGEAAETDASISIEECVLGLRVSTDASNCD